ncbi:MAG: hypothetical protein ACJAVR_001413 [Paracoccaceae bacterium]|jgi:hypothetical protein
MPRLHTKRPGTTVAAIVATGLLVANAAVGVSVALALNSGDPEQGATTLSSPHMAVTAGAMVFALSGFASVLAMRLLSITATAKE